MSRLWLVRHGPTRARTMLGWTDRPADLSDADALARLSALLPDAPVVSSDLVRATATADAIGAGRERLAHAPDLREFHYGDWEDRPFDAIDGPRLRAFFDAPGDVAAPGGESWNDVVARAGAALDRLDRPELIVVCHFGVILSLWAEAAGLPPAEAVAQRVEPLSVTRIDRGTAPRAHWVNRRP